MDNLKSVNDIAKALGTNKPKVWRIIRSLGISERSTNGNRTLYAEEDINRIRAEFLRLQDGKPNVHTNDRTNDLKSTEKTESTSRPEIDLEQIKKQVREETKEEVKVYYEMLIKEKDKRIDELKESLEKANDQIDELNETRKRDQSIIQAQLLTIASTKPRLIDRIKSHFAKEQVNSDI